VRPLPRRALGSSGLELSLIGLGSAAFGGPGWASSWGSQDDRVSITTIRHAVENGINWIDTAPIYGQGHAEVVIGRALHEIDESEQPYVFTKCGLVWDEDKVGKPRRVLTPRNIRSELEASLRRLGVERIDLYQIHYPPQVDSSTLEECWAEMAALAMEGTVRAVGVCNFAVEQLDRCQPIRHIDSIQPPFSVIHPEARLDLIPWSRDHQTGVIVYRSLESGLLTDGFSRDRIENLERTDWRNDDPDFRSPQLERNLSLRDVLVPMARVRGASVASVAVAWTLACPGVSGAIVGARTPQQIDGWLSGADLRLTASELETIDVTLRQGRPATGLS
jgi:aryl-alcohol dehydrogenase-like predicted oxidoreductase